MGAIYTASLSGGSPQLVHAPEGPIDRYLSSPAFSPDGTKIVYVDGRTDVDNSIRVMDADGSHVRMLLDQGSMPAAEVPGYACSWLNRIQWSPDGSHLAFACDQGIWVMGADGSGLTKVVRNASFPEWSPDGTQLAYMRPAFPGGGEATVEIVALDGTHVRELGPGGTGPWNPLPLAEAPESPAASPRAGPAAPSPAMIALLVLVAAAGAVSILRSRKKVSA
jgi:dipeptidyl aminopeptidase/acylaminoacyl peptidase